LRAEILVRLTALRRDFELTDLDFRAFFRLAIF
jgi:hypothetical protein